MGSPFALSPQSGSFPCAAGEGVADGTRSARLLDPATEGGGPTHLCRALRVAGTESRPAPSTMRRMVPLPRDFVAGEDTDCGHRAHCHLLIG
jgi:hypothetical protein